MASRSDVLSPWAIRGLYLLAALLVFWPIVDLLTNTWPMQIGNFRWRYGFAGLLGGFHLTPLFGYVLALFVSASQAHGKTLRFVSIAGFVVAFLLLLIMVMFPLDTLQVRAERDPSVLPAVMAGAVIAEAKHFTTFLVLVLMSAGAWSTSGRLKHASSADQKVKPSVLIRPDRGGTASETGK